MIEVHDNSSVSHKKYLYSKTYTTSSALPRLILVTNVLDGMTKYDKKFRLNPITSYHIEYQFFKFVHFVVVKRNIGSFIFIFPRQFESI